MKYNLSRDGKAIMTGDEFEILRYIHKNHCFSLDWACKYEGYSLEESKLPICGKGE